MKKISCKVFIVISIVICLFSSFAYLLIKPKNEQYSQTANIHCYTRDEQEINVEVWYVYDSDEELDVNLIQSVVSSTRTILSEYTFKDITVEKVAVIERLLTEKVQLENEQIDIERVTIREVEKIKKEMFE